MPSTNSATNISNTKTITIVDTFGFFFSSFHALPPLKSKSGFPTGLLTGFVNLISSLHKNHESDYIVFALDSKKGNFRKKIDPNYKANRKPAPPELLSQLPVAIDFIDKMGLFALEVDNFEADDLIASVVKFAKAKNMRANIVSFDKDLYQLIDENVYIFNPRSKSFVGIKECFEKYSIPPSKIKDYLSIIGDSSDNIPGVSGIGPKGAVGLINEFGSLEGIYANLEQIQNQRLKSLLIASKDNAFLSQKLVELRDDSLGDFDFERAKFPLQNPLLNIKQDLAKYDIKAIFGSIDSSLTGLSHNNAQNSSNNNTYQVAQSSPDTKSQANSQNKNYAFESILLDSKEKLFEVIAKIPPNSIVAFDTETTSLDHKTAKIVGFSFAFEKNIAYYAPIAHSYLGVGHQVSFTQAKEALQKLFANKIIGQNLKYDLAIVRNNFGLEFAIESDTMVISWLLNPVGAHGLDYLAKREFGHDMIKFSDVVAKDENFAFVPLDEACKYASEDAWMSLGLYHKLYNMLSDELRSELLKVEIPFIKVLLEMESVGFKIDVEFFKRLSKTAQESLDTLTKQIHFISGEEFNINSTKQLSSILFDKLALKSIKQTKTGQSTNESVLEQLADKHPIIPIILEYRELFKLKSTYIDPLLIYAQKDPNHRVYTSFLHTGTATGRLSSKNPNLQNIPTRKESGKQIRRGFISKDGFRLISLDYSQIELRLLAHFSQDGELTRAFRQDKDIHLETAKKIFGEELALQNRHIAKEVNFGLIYGMGSQKLSKTINVSQKQAKEYIQSYFASFPTVKGFLQSSEELIRSRGYAQTLLGRRRFFDFESVGARDIAMFLREGINTIFQGSASDLIKLAMNRCFERFHTDQNIKMLTQIHDELIFEVKEELCEGYAIEIKNIMQDIYSLHVPLRVDYAIGTNWSEL